MILRAVAFWIALPIAVLICAGPGFWVCAQWDRGAFDGWAYTVPLPLFHPVLRLQPSLAATDAAREADDLRRLNAALGQCGADQAAMGRAIAEQNAAIAAAAARSVSALAQAKAADTRAAQAELKALGEVRILSRPIAGDGVCARVQAFDKTFLGLLK